MKSTILTTILILTLLLSLNFLMANENPIESDSVRYKFAPVVVTGQRYEMSQKDVASSISIIEAQEIQNTNFSTPAEIISYFTPGVFTTRRSNLGFGVAALAGGSINIRGIGGKPNTQILMLIDGRPDYQGIFSHPINDAYLLENVDHVEVLRGPASAVYGTNALGGVVNIITKKLPKNGFNTNIKLGYGSHNTQGYLFQHSGNLGKFQYYTSASLNTSDGHRENGDFERQNYSVKLGYRFNKHYEIAFNGSMTPYEYHDPGPQDIALMGYFDYGDITRSSADITLSNNFKNTDGTIKIHGNFGKHSLSDGWESDDQTNGIIAFQNFQLPYQMTTTVGLDIKRYGGTANSNGNNLGTYFNDEIATYVHLKKVVAKKLVLATGVRLEDNSHFGREWIPKFGVVVHPFSQTAIRSSVAKGFRTPSVKDLYLFNPANTDLQPEKLWNYEIGINQYLGQHFSIDVCGFYYEGDQLIQMAVVEPGKMLNMNVGSNKAKGFEVSLRSTPLTHLSLNLSYSYLDSDEKIPFAPNKFNYFISYKLNKLNVSLYGEAIQNLYTSYQLNQFPPKTTIEKSSNYGVVHMKFSYELFKNFNWSLSLENLFDESYEILKGYPMPGRTFYSSIQFHL